MSVFVVVDVTSMRKKDLGGKKKKKKGIDDDDDEQRHEREKIDVLVSDKRIEEKSEHIFFIIRQATHVSRTHRTPFYSILEI
jgi:hypothetical protein